MQPNLAQAQRLHPYKGESWLYAISQEAYIYCFFAHAAARGSDASTGRNVLTEVDELQVALFFLDGQYRAQPAVCSIT